MGLTGQGAFFDPVFVSQIHQFTGSGGIAGQAIQGMIGKNQFQNIFSGLDDRIGIGFNTHHPYRTKSSAAAAGNSSTRRTISTTQRRQDSSGGRAG